MPRIAPVPIEELPPEHRRTVQAAIDDPSSLFHDPCLVLTYAHSPRALDVVVRMLPIYPHMGYEEIFGRDLCELLRLRSAQLGGCAVCQQQRYEANSEELVCAIDQPHALGARERLALRFMSLMHTDHFAIDQAFFRELGELFTAGEIVDLGMMVSQMVGAHRWMHVLRLNSPDAPVVGVREDALAPC